MNNEDLPNEPETLILGDEATILIPSETEASARYGGGESPGKTIGHYTLLEKIGEGGFGTVWRAEQHEPVRRIVALKIIKLGMDTREVIARFEQERQALALMEHPGIAKVLDAGTTESGRPYFVMELVAGIPITKFCDREKLAVRERLALFLQVCAAIQHAHQKGIIHRDIKPSNLLVARDDTGQPTLKVIDFGIAKATAGKLTEMTLMTEAEQMIGTPAYMSPEQAGLENGQDIDTRCDIYAMGVVLYELLTGRTPFDPRTLLSAGYEEMRRIIREQEPPRPSTRLGALGDADSTTIAASRSSELPRLITTIRRELDWVVMKAIEKERTRRYDAANSFARDIERFLHDEPVAARPPSKIYRVRKFVRRNRAAVMTTTAIFIALVAGIVFYIIQIQSERDEVRKSEAKTRILLAQSLGQNAELSAQRGLWKEALNQWDAALAAGHPKPEDIRLRRIQALILQDRISDAREAIQQLDAMELNPSQRAQLSVLKAEDLFLQGKTKQGVELLKSIPSGQLPPEEAAYVRGLLAENTPDALAAFRETVEILPYHHSANARLCFLLVFAGQLDEASRRVHAATALFPSDSMLSVIDFQIEKLRGNQETVAALRKKLDQAPPTTQEAVLIMESVFDGFTAVGGAGVPQEPSPTNLLKTMAKSMALIDKMRGLGKKVGMNIERYGAPYIENVMANFHDAGMKHFLSKNPKAGLEALEKALQHHRVGDMMFLKGLMLMDMGEFEKAAAVYQEGAKLPAMNPRLHVLCKIAAGVAFSLAKPDNPEYSKKAYAQYKPFLKIPDLDDLDLVTAATSALNSGELEEARAWYAMIGKESPRRAEAAALVESVSGDYERAWKAVHSVSEAQRGALEYQMARANTIFRLSMAQPQIAKVQRLALQDTAAAFDTMATAADKPDASREQIEEAVTDGLLRVHLCESLRDMTSAKPLLQQLRKWIVRMEKSPPQSQLLSVLGPILAEVALRIPLTEAAEALNAKKFDISLHAANDGLAAYEEIAWLDPKSDRMKQLAAQLEMVRSNSAAQLESKGISGNPESGPLDIPSLEIKLQSLQESKGQEGRETVQTMIQLSSAYGADGSGRKSIKLGEQALGIIRSKLPTDKTLLMDAMRILIRNYRAVDLESDAKALEIELSELEK